MENFLIFEAGKTKSNKQKIGVTLSFLHCLVSVEGSRFKSAKQKEVHPCSNGKLLIGQTPLR